MMEEAIAACLSDETTSFFLKFIELITGASPDSIQESNVINAMVEMEIYIKGRDRIDLIKSIKDQEVHLFGNGLDTLNRGDYFKNSNVVIHSPLDYLEALKVMKQSKIVLNSSIKNKRGAHERIFSAAACGAVVVTNDNTYMRENFVDNQEIIMYRRSDFANVNARLHDLLSNDTKRQTIAEAGREKVMANHTWDHRIAALLPQISPIIEKMKQMDMENNH